MLKNGKVINIIKVQAQQYSNIKNDSFFCSVIF